MELSGGFFAAQLIGVVSYFFIVRIYEPDVFGMASVFFAITGILTVISCLGYELAIILPAKDEEAVNILSAAVLTAAFFAALTGILSHLFRFALSEKKNRFSKIIFSKTFKKLFKKPQNPKILKESSILLSLLFSLYLRLSSFEI